MKDDEYDAVIATPPCHTHSRACYSGKDGPAPLRSAKHPLGFPWLQGKQLEKVTAANAMVTFSFRILAEQAKRWRRGLVALGLLEHPEDLGRRPKGTPASIWQLLEHKSLLKFDGWQSGALHQCAFGAPSSKPTRFATNVEPFTKSLKLGVPVFDPNGYYAGPLPRECGYSHTGDELMTRTPDGGFGTAAAAAYPPGLNDAIAKSLVEAFLMVKDKSDSPADGELAAPASDFKVKVELRPRITSPCQIPKRAFLGAVVNWLPEHVYIGRGAKGHPRSRWANPVKIAGETNRARAVEEFRNLLHRSPEMLAELPTLAGKTLVCHCLPKMACHADPIIEAFRQLIAEDVLPPPDPVGSPRTKRKAVAERALAEAESVSKGDVDVKIEHVPDVEVEGPILKMQSRALRGWRGAGPPLRARDRRGQRDFHDGGGLCSPGRWAPAQRRYPVRGRNLLDPLVEALKTITATVDLKKLLYFMASGRMKVCPFPDHVVDEIRKLWSRFLTPKGWHPEPQAGDREQPIRVRMLQALLGYLADPDIGYLGQVAQGVPLGVDEDMPRTPMSSRRR